MRSWAVGPLVLLALSCGESTAPSPEQCGHLELVLRLGSDERPETALRYVSSVALDGLGRVFVAQPHANQVIVFDSTGNWLTSLGFAGSGPGGFSIPVRVGTKGDSIYVSNNGRRSLDLFTPDLRFARRISLHGTLQDYQTNGPEGFFANGSLLLPTLAPSAMPAGEPIDEFPLLAISDSGLVVDTIVWLTTRNSTLAIRHPERPSLGHFGDQPFADHPLWALAPDGAGVALVDRRTATDAREGTFTLTRINGAGDTIFTRTHRYGPVRMPPPLLDSVRAELVRLALRSRGLDLRTVGAARRAVDAALFQPAFLPPVTQIVVGDDRAIWIRREDREGRHSLWERYDGESGAFELRVTGPKAWKGMAARGRRLWGVEADSLDVPYVACYQVRRTSCTQGPSADEPLRD